MKIAVIRFPGTNNEYETLRAIKYHGGNGEIFNYFDELDKLSNFDGFWLAGGFSYGDVLRAGAIAAKSKMMNEIIKQDKPILGTCNGFQILTEADILPGALIPNEFPRFICKLIHVKIPENDSFLNELQNKVLRLPIAHFEGNLWLDDINQYNSIAYYSDSNGNIKADPTINPNGSDKNIAGLASDDGRVVGMMPHPERACLPYHESRDGKLIIEAFLKEVKK